MATKPSWAKTRVLWERKVQIWTRMAKGENDVQVGVWLDLQGYGLDRDTVGKVREELGALPKELAANLRGEVQEYWKQLEPQIQQAAKEGERPPMAGVLSSKEEGRLLGALVGRQQVEAHREAIRSTIGKLLPCLPFVEPWCLNNLNISRGALGDTSGRAPVLHWDFRAGHILRHPNKEFNPLIEHIESSGQTNIIEQLKRWQEQGGECIEKCCQLKEKIRGEVERITQLGQETSLVNSYGGAVPPRLSDGFVRSLYMMTLGYPEDRMHLLPRATVGDLVLLRAMGRSDAGIAFNRRVSAGEEAHMRALQEHEPLIKWFREFPVTKQIGALVAEMKEVDRALADALAQFSSQSPMPGRCSHCPE